MEAKSEVYIPFVFRSFQGFQVKDIKEWRGERHMEIILEKEISKIHLCSHCGGVMGAFKGGYWITAKHMRMMDWAVDVVFMREKRYCPGCKRVRAELIDFIFPIEADATPFPTPDKTPPTTTMYLVMKEKINHLL